MGLPAIKSARIVTTSGHVALVVTFVDGRKATIWAGDEKFLHYTGHAVMLGDGFARDTCYVMPRDPRQGRNEDEIIPGVTVNRTIVALMTQVMQEADKGGVRARRLSLKAPRRARPAIIGAWRDREDMVFCLWADAIDCDSKHPVDAERAHMLYE